MKYKTAMGKVVDMGVLAAKNEKSRAVGNMKVNARGDTIDSTGKVIKPITNKVNENYSKTVGNRSANIVRRPPEPIERNKVKPDIVKEELTELEKELEAEFEDDLEVEQIKAKEINSNYGNTSTQDQ
jgi:hypothetical protein